MSTPVLIYYFTLQLMHGYTHASILTWHKVSLNICLFFDFPLRSVSTPVLIRYYFTHQLMHRYTHTSILNMAQD